MACSAVPGTITLPAGTVPIEVKATNCVGTSATCSSLVTVTTKPPKAVCQPALLLPATAKCAAQIATADLIKAIDAGSTPGSGGTLSLTLEPGPNVLPAPAGGAPLAPIFRFQGRVQGQPAGRVADKEDVLGNITNLHPTHHYVECQMTC